MQETYHMVNNFSVTKFCQSNYNEEPEKLRRIINLFVDMLTNNYIIALIEDDYCVSGRKLHQNVRPE